MAPKMTNTIPCPHCGATGTESRRVHLLDNGCRRRYRQCRQCHHKFKTLQYEGEPEKIAPLSEHGNSKLTSQDVRDIRKLLAAGVSQKDLSIQYDIGTRAIYCIQYRKTWSHVQ